MKEQVDCDKCQGTGYISAYAHIDNGQCHKCHGTGKVNKPRAIKAKVSPKEAARQAYLAQQETETALVRAEWKRDPRWAALAQNPARLWAKYGMPINNTPEGIEGGIAVAYAYMYNNGARDYEVARERLSERGIQRPW